MDGGKVQLADERLRPKADEWPQLMCRFRPDGTLTWVNRAFQRCFGQPGRELAGSNLLDLLPQGERSVALSRLKRLASGCCDLAPPCEHRVICGDGSVRWQQWIDRAIRDASGRVIEFQSFGRDITERKLAEELLASRVWLETMLGDFSAALAEVPAANLEEEIGRWLARLAEAFDFEQAMVAALAGASRLPVKRMLGATGFAPLPSNVIDDVLPWVAKELRHNRVVILDDPKRDLPLEAVRDRDFLTRTGITAALMIPLAVEARPVGAIWFASWRRERRELPGELMLRLSRAGPIVAGALMRQRATEALLASEALSRGILSSIASPIAVLDRTGAIIAANAAWQRAGQALGSERPAFGIEVGADYLAASRRATTGEARAVIDGIEAVLAGQRDGFELDYVCPSPGVRRWYRMAVTPLREVLQGAVIIHTDITPLKRVEEELRGLSGRLIRAQEEAARALARELHDNVAQRLALLGLGLDQLRGQLPSAAAASLGALLGGLRALQGELDTLFARLHPFELQHLGLVGALRSLCGRLSAQHRVTIDVSLEALPEPLPEAVSLGLYRVAQEALANALKHSGSETIRVALGCADGELQLLVADRGRGFDPAALQIAKARLGLLSMRERTRLMNGTFDLAAAPGQGVQVLVQVPLSGAQGEVGF
jgi:PAS domain S-box-containing protein